MSTLCQVEFAVDASLIDNDQEQFQQHIRRAFQAYQQCAQVAKEELSRARVGDQNVDQLLTELLGIGETRALAGADAPVADAERTPPVPAKSKAAVAKPAPQPAKFKKAVAEKLEPLISTRNGIVLAVCVVLSCFAWWLNSSGAPTMSGLAAKALSASKAEERLDAAVSLTLLKVPEMRPHLERVASESQDPEIVVVAINGLVAYGDVRSFPVLVAALEHPQQKVREVALAGVTRKFAESTLEGVEFKADDSPEKRAQAVAKLKDNMAQEKARIRAEH